MNFFTRDGVRSLRRIVDLSVSVVVVVVVVAVVFVFVFFRGCAVEK
jgi:hypothetical protein